jgi:hypothetical protein
MKIKLTLSKDTVLTVYNMLNQLYNLPVSNIQRENIYKSIGFDLADKFESKAKELKKNSNLLNQKNKVEMTLKFYQAWALHEIIHELLEVVLLDHYQENQISMLLQKIHPQII